jgi:hypothetical protein
MPEVYNRLSAHVSTETSFFPKYRSAWGLKQTGQALGNAHIINDHTFTNFSSYT